MNLETNGLNVSAFLSSYSFVSNVTHRRLFLDLTVRSADGIRVRLEPLQPVTPHD